MRKQRVKNGTTFTTKVTDFKRGSEKTELPPPPACGIKDVNQPLLKPYHEPDVLTAFKMHSYNSHRPLAPNKFGLKNSKRKYGKVFPEAGRTWTPPAIVVVNGARGTSVWQWELLNERSL